MPGRSIPMFLTDNGTFNLNPDTVTLMLCDKCYEEQRVIDVGKDFIWKHYPNGCAWMK